MAKAPPPGTRAPRNRPAPTGRTTPAKSRAVAAPGFAVTVDGVRHVVVFDAVTAFDESELRRATGMSWLEFMKAARSSPGMDIIAGIVWLARRQAGEPDLDYRSVASEITKATAVSAAGAAKAADLPEA